MHLCPNCAAEIIPGAKFCHRCGDKIKEKTKDCPACHAHSPLGSVFCHHCGYHFEGRHTHPEQYKPFYLLDFAPEDLTPQIKSLFFRCLRHRVEEEHDIERYSEYVERFYRSRFREIYAARSEQIARDAKQRWERFGTEGLEELDKQIDAAFEGLLDFFIIQYCPDLNGVILPPEILKYEKAAAGKTNLWQMFRDFLDIEREDERFYLDFITMPPEYLANACKSFLSAGRHEKLYLICDLSLKGQCKEGFALTDHGIYWKSPFDRPRKANFRRLDYVGKEKEWLKINGHYFNANPSLNLKLYKLLKKLRGWGEGSTFD